MILSLTDALMVSTRKHQKQKETKDHEDDKKYRGKNQTERSAGREDEAGESRTNGASGADPEVDPHGTQ